jgi:two-component system response regulator DesR
MVRIVLVEDQAMVRGALAALLSTQRDMCVVAEVADGVEALRAVESTNPDVVITDVEMPNMSGLELAAQLHRQFRHVNILILSTFTRPGYLRRALDCGARGYMLKDSPAAELAEAVRRVKMGIHIIDPALAAGAWEIGPDPLTERERQILTGAGAGKSNLQIAQGLFLSEGTVKNYLAEINAKLGTANRTEASAKARALGWI